MKKIFFAGITALIISLQFINAQVTEVKLMSWNLLNWPAPSSSVADSTNRCPYYRDVVQYENPDILVTMENSTINSVDWFLQSVMNPDSGHSYAAGTYIRGTDTNNGIFYRDSL